MPKRLNRNTSKQSAFTIPDLPDDHPFDPIMGQRPQDSKGPRPVTPGALLRGVISKLLTACANDPR